MLGIKNETKDCELLFALWFVLLDGMEEWVGGCVFGRKVEEDSAEGEVGGADEDSA